MADRVAAYNARHGLTGEAQVVYRPRSFSLVLPTPVVRPFYDKCVVPICSHMQHLLVEAAKLRRPLGLVFLVGGFAESLYLQRSVREALQTDAGPAATLVVAAKPVQCVNRGAAVWGLYPNSFISSRVAKMTIAVSLCERYNPAVHDPVPHPSYMINTPEGVYVENVLLALVQRNDDVGTSEVRETEVSPVRDAQGTVLFKLYRVDRRLPPHTVDTPRTYLITARAAEGVPKHLAALHVPESALVGHVTVNTGAGPASQSRAKLSLFFGRTEIKALAHSRTTGDSRQVSIQWDMATAGDASAAAAAAARPPPAAAPLFAATAPADEDRPTAPAARKERAVAEEPHQEGGDIGGSARAGAGAEAGAEAGAWGRGGGGGGGGPLRAQATALARGALKHVKGRSEEEEGGEEAAEEEEEGGGEAAAEEEEGGEEAGAAAEEEEVAAEEEGAALEEVAAMFF